MLDFSGSALTFGENGEAFVGLFWFFSSTTPSSVAIVKSSFLNCNVYVVVLFLFVFCSQTSDSLVLFFSALLITVTIFLSSSYYWLLSPRNNDYFPKCLLQRALLFQRALWKKGRYFSSKGHFGKRVGTSLPKGTFQSASSKGPSQDYRLCSCEFSEPYIFSHLFLFIWLLWVAQMWDLWSLLWSAGSLFSCGMWTDSYVLTSLASADLPFFRPDLSCSQ